MKVPPVSQTSPLAAAAQALETREVGPDHDGDRDDAAKAAASPTVTAAPAPGTGLKVDKTI